MNIFVGNLSYDSTEEGLKSLFEQHGAVDAARIITDRETGRSRGFGFIEMSDNEAGKAAMAALDGYELDGRPLKVNEAQPKGDRGGRGGGGGGGGGGRW